MEIVFRRRGAATDPFWLGFDVLNSTFHNNPIWKPAALGIEQKVEARVMEGIVYSILVEMGEYEDRSIAS